MTPQVANRNTGHGHVWERPDGVRMRCGGPKICAQCAIDYANYHDQPLPDPEKFAAEALPTLQDERVATVRALAIEEAARVCESYIEEARPDTEVMFRDLAAAIRALQPTLEIEKKP